MTSPYKSQYLIWALLSAELQDGALNQFPPLGYFRCTEYPCVSLFFALPRTPESQKATGNHISFSFASTEQAKAARVFQFWKHSVNF